VIKPVAGSNTGTTASVSTRAQNATSASIPIFSRFLPPRVSRIASPSPAGVRDASRHARRHSLPESSCTSPRPAASNPSTIAPAARQSSSPISSRVPAHKIWMGLGSFATASTTARAFASDATTISPPRPACNSAAVPFVVVNTTSRPPHTSGV
jgi:hypothetical protein